MERATIDRPGLIIFLSGMACVLAAMALGFYLTHETGQFALRLQSDEWDFHSSPNLDRASAEMKSIEMHLANVRALIWMTFGLGVVPTMVGLRMLARPNPGLFGPGPIKPPRDVFENLD